MNSNSFPGFIALLYATLREEEQEEEEEEEQEGQR